MSISFEWVGPDELVANPWNPNEMTPFIFAKELDSIREHGMIDPILVRETQVEHPRFEIIDGEHRWRAAGDLGLPEIPIANLGVVSDAVAKRLTITMNELRGTSNSARMADLLRDLASMTPLDELVDKLPFTSEVFTAMTGLGSLPSLPGTSPDPSPAGSTSEESSRRWVERTYRLPSEAAAVLDEAMARAKGADPDVADWQAIEAIAAEFLATYGTND